MELREAYDEARRLLREHGLDDWRVELDRAKRRAGVCRHRDRVIGLSMPLTRLHEPAEVRATILHEIAHALAGPAAGHGPQWQALARRLGCPTDRCLPADAPQVPGAWVGVCCGGHTMERHRRPVRVAACGRCSPKFSAEHVFEWTFHGQPAAMHPNYLAELAALGSGDAMKVAGVGAVVRILAAGRLEGRLGVVVKVGRTRYHLRVPEGIVTVVFAGAEPVRRVAAEV